jgi:hypothetical protein
VEDLNIYGVAIPTFEGAKNVLNYLNAGPQGNSNVIWINLREGFNQRPTVNE